MSEQALAIPAQQTQALVFDNPTKELIRRSISDPKAPLTNDEFSLFLQVCQFTGLNPMLKEIYAFRSQGRLAIVTGIDGFRRTAQLSGRYLGQAGPMWCGPDGEWVDVWLKDIPPAAAKVGIWMRGAKEPTWGVATMKGFKKGTLLWESNPSHMLAVRAETHALRKCFSRELGSIGLAEDDDTPQMTSSVVSDPEPPQKALGADPAWEELGSANTPAQDEYHRGVNLTEARAEVAPLKRAMTAAVQQRAQEKIKEDDTPALGNLLDRAKTVWGRLDELGFEAPKPLNRKAVTLELWLAEYEKVLAIEEAHPKKDEAPPEADADDGLIF